MLDVRLPIFQSAAAAWRDAIRAVRAMPNIFLVAYVVLTLQSLFWAFARAGDSGGVGALFASAANSFHNYSAFAMLFVAPWAIAVHRFVQLDDVQKTWGLDGRAMAYWVLFIVLLGWFRDFAISIPHNWQDFAAIFSLTFNVARALSTPFILSYVVLLMPAQAVNPGGFFDLIAGFSTRVPWMKGWREWLIHSWNVCAAVLCTTAPALTAFCAFALPLVVFPSWPTRAFFALAVSALGALLAAALAALASSFLRITSPAIAAGQEQAG